MLEIPLSLLDEDTPILSTGIPPPNCLSSCVPGLVGMGLQLIDLEGG